MNDIQILREMISLDVQVMLQPGQGRPSVELIDPQSGATVKIKGYLLTLLSSERKILKTLLLFLMGQKVNASGLIL